MRFISLIVALALAIPAQSFAEDCGPDVRLDAPGGSMEKVAPLDQKSLPICYAFSAAEMLQTWRCSHGAGNCDSSLVSPVSVAVNAELFEINHGTAKPAGLEGQGAAFWGYVRKQIQAADLFHGPYCEQSALGPLDRSSELNQDINDLFAQYKKKCVHAVSLGFGSPSSGTPADLVSCRLLDDQPLSHKSFTDFAAGVQSCLNKDGVPVDLHQVETALVSSDPLLLIQGEIQDRCRANPAAIPPMPAIDFYSIKPNSSEAGADPAGMAKARQAIAAEFDKMGSKGQPVFVTYCADVLASGRSYIPSYGADCSGAHASLIIGRRKITIKDQGGERKVCQYLVRNSWGKTCKRDVDSRYHYSTDWDCDRDKGDYWIDQDVMMKAALEVGGVEGEGIGGLMPPSYLSSRTAPSR